MHATTEGTKRYKDRLNSITAEGHLREHQGLMMSSIGLGTYLGHYDGRTDDLYRQAIVRAVELGVNVIDSAINYRFQRSERSIGKALQDLANSGKASRDEIVIATKAGYLTFDGAPPPKPRDYFIENYIKTGIVAPEDIVAGNHCMTPRYLEDQIHRSLSNLGVDSIDIFYVHNPESQFEEVNRPEFFKRLHSAFELLEGKVREGKIRMYGTATWNAYRNPPDALDSLSLADVVKCARDVAGDQHHFRVIQLPYNLAMPEAYGRNNQRVDSKMVSTLEAAAEFGVAVMASASIFQARLSRNLPAFIGERLQGLETDSQRSIQFVRSTPGVAVALVGMSQVAHVEENLFLARVPPASPETIHQMLHAS